MVHRVLDPLKVQKTNSSMNTDDDDNDTISMMSFEDPVDFDNSLEEDMNLDKFYNNHHSSALFYPATYPPYQLL